MSDAIPLNERAFAVRAQIGFIGRNAMVIRPGIGSYFLLAELVTDLEVSDVGGLSGEVTPRSLRLAPPAAPPNFEGCGRCERCKPHCPTGAIVEDGIVDARRCISYLTIEKRGPLQEHERLSLGEWVFGCDLCQEACPFNHRAHRGALPPVSEPFRPTNGAGPYLDLTHLLRIRSESDFLTRFAGTPLMRARREGLVRNAACVAVCTTAEEVLPALHDAALEDPSVLVRQHAVWAFLKLGDRLSLAKQERAAFLNRVFRDPSSAVSDELKPFLGSAPAH